MASYDALWRVHVLELARSLPFGLSGVFLADKEEVHE
jgi:hypothetical protein